MDFQYAFLEAFTTFCYSIVNLVTKLALTFYFIGDWDELIGLFIVNFENISNLVQVFWLLILNI